jgi:5-methylcytosine-specific restriction endonuclease McrA
MSTIRTGQYFPCMICGKEFYRRASYIRRGIRKTCGDPACKSASMSGPNNPFWGKVHDEETLQRIRETRRARPPGKKTGPPKGYHHTPEARAKITEALKHRWRENRDKMLAAVAKATQSQRLGRNSEPRYRLQFTPMQRRDWKDAQCAWCGATDKLILDHIIPVMCGGTNERKNVQTLCQPCNIWKMRYVDRSLLLAGLGSNGD